MECCSHSFFGLCVNCLKVCLLVGQSWTDVAGCVGFKGPAGSSVRIA